MSVPTDQNTVVRLSSKTCFNYIPTTNSVKYDLYICFTDKLTDAPKTMYVSKDQWVEEGHPLRLFCEAMIGELIYC